jgi:hypothetical protein
MSAHAELYRNGLVSYADKWQPSITNLNHPRSESKLSVRCTIGFSHRLQAHGDPPTKRSVFRVCNRRCTLAAQPDLGSEYSMFRDPATQYKLPISGQTAQRQRATIEKSL